jgi:hypothetical protein
MANMAVDCADLYHHGWLDLFTTNYQTQAKMLLKNLGNGTFEDVATAARAAASCYPYVNWGCGLVDLDNDGRKDIFVVNGHTEDNVELYDKSTCYKCRNKVYWNAGDGTFVDVSETAGDGLQGVFAGRGVCFEDLDNDGDLDVVILNSRDRPTILRNMLYELGSKNHWLEIRLRGVKTNRDGVGARVRVVAGDLVQTDEVHAGRGYQSHWGSRLHFGLGEHAAVDRIEVHWIGGGVEVLENVPADRLLTVTEGRFDTRQ